MGATTTEGTGPGSVTVVKPPILNGVVKAENIDINDLKNYKHDVETDGYVHVGTDLVVNGTTQLNGVVSVFAPVNVAGNVVATGYVRGRASGQLVNTYVANVSSGNVTTSGNTSLTLATISYAPVSSVAVNLFVEFDADYSVAGNGADSFQSSIAVGGTPIASRTQSWGTLSGQGTRSGVLFPIKAVYHQTGTSPLAITVNVVKTAGDDTVTVYQSGSDSATVRISEYIA
jgi:hypothetical protein